MDLYQKLQVDRNASDKEIRSAYRKKVQQLHPDHSTGDPSDFRDVQEAYEVLSDQTARQAYDRELESQSARPVGTRGQTDSPVSGVYEVFPGASGVRETVREVNRSGIGDQSSVRGFDRRSAASDSFQAEWDRLLDFLFGRF